MGAPHNPARYGELWPQARIDALGLPSEAWASEKKSKPKAAKKGADKASPKGADKSAATKDT